LSAFATATAAESWILIVDDDPMMARALSRMLLVSTGARVAIVASVDAALRLVSRAREAPAVAVLDFELGRGETGVQALLSLRASGSDVPCVFHTGVPGRVRDALDASRLGRSYLVFEKGSSESDLVAFVAGVVAQGPAHARSGTRRRVTPS
jgi:ActR/RegA family two-component response regulator